MDGTENYSFTSRSARRRIAGVSLAFLLLTAQLSPADVPPRLQIDGDAKPLNSLSAAGTSTGWRTRNGQSTTQRATITRPRARLIEVDQPATVVPRTQIVRPPARILVQKPSAQRRRSEALENSPTIKKLSGRSDGPAATTVSTLAHPVSNPPVASTRPTRVTVEQALETNGSVTFRGTPLSEVVFLLSELWHINIVAGENVSGEVNGSFHNAPLREVLSAALTATGYSYRQTGNSLIVLPIEQVGADDPNFASETISIPDALQGDDTMLEAAQLLLSERGQLRKIGESSMLLVDSPERIAKIRQFVSDLTPRQAPVTPESAGTISHDPTLAAPNDTPGLAPAAVTQSGIAYFSPQFTEAAEMAEPLQTAMGEEVIVAVYPEENRIMVKGSPDQLRLASEAIEQLDKPRAQVRITAMIYDVGLGELEKIGINWTRDLRANANAQNEALGQVTQSINELIRFNADLTSSGGASIGVATLKDTLAAGAFLELLDNTTEAKLLADPTVTVGDRRQASIRIVRKIPIVGANPVENSNAVFTQTEFEEAGVILNVNPRISRDGTIELQVQPEYSVVAEITPTGPVIDSRTADTTIRVANGQMFVLGGLRQKSVVESVRGIPYLKDIKHIGKLFRSHDTEVRESELIVFLKPEIITPYSPGEPRQQRAADVSTQELDAIAHAETVPMTPCCRDPYCPNHYPRPRNNGGSRSLEMLGGNGPHDFESHGSHEVQIIEEVVDEPFHRGQQSQVQPPTETEQPTHVINDVYPPVHIDTRMLTPTRAVH